ncbi:MAG: helix-turn-helix domain-containing protein [Catonella sp.]|uniref:helix-turn-helix domain-containing protein n=1 Tax=Catonella sp. TaxID=2382125 RepID=UPI003F9FCD7B
MGFSNYKITDKPSDTAKSNLIYITYTKYEHDWSSFMHTHPFTELFLVTGGAGEFYVENDKYPLKKGDFIIVNPNTVHTEKSTEKNPLEYIVVAVDNFSLNLKNSNHFIFNCINKHSDIIKYMDSMLLEQQDSKPYSDQVCRNILEIILIEILRTTKLNVDTEPTISASKECFKLKKYLDSNYSSKITIDDLAKLSNLNKYYLIHSFNKYFGDSPINYLCKIRIRVAKELLTNSDYSISQIAQSAGFSSQSYFTQCFIKDCGLSPTSYRQQVKNH